jgi:hypothetical protein
MTRKAMLLAIAIGAASAPISPIFAQTIKGSGNDSCGEWLQHRQAIAAQRATNVHVTLLSMEQSWIDGFVSGINATKAYGDVDLLGSHPGEGMYVWVDNYCRSKPLDSILGASISLARELRSQAERK